VISATQRALKRDANRIHKDGTILSFKDMVEEFQENQKRCKKVRFVDDIKPEEKMKTVVLTLSSEISHV